MLEGSKKQPEVHIYRRMAPELILKGGVTALSQRFESAKDPGFIPGQRVP